MPGKKGKDKGKEKEKEKEKPTPFLPFSALVKELVLSCIRSVEPGPDRNPYKALVLDPFTRHLISSHVKMYDILEEGVDIVENLEIPREPLPNKEAIYFISPTRESIQHVIDDFDPEKMERRKDQYASVHLFFTSALDDSLFSKLTQAQVRAYIGSLKELNLLFLLQEKQLFHTEDPQALRTLYSPLSDRQQVDDFLGSVAFKLSTVFTTIGEIPLIRYDKSSSAAKKLGRSLKERMEELEGQGLELSKKIDAPADERCTILIVSRSYDLVAPLLHEFTYQSMIYDLLSVDDKHRVEHIYTDNAGKEQTKKVVMNDESDQLWVKLRHMHIADTSKWVVKNFNDFIAANKKAGNLEMGKTTNLKEMGEAMRAMPQYQDMKSKYAVHIELVSRCMGIFKEKGLKELGMTEQDLVMGVKRKSYKKDLSHMFDDERYSKSDKLRLLLIYLISQAEQGRLSLKEKGEVVVDAGYPPDPQGDHKILKCLEAMGVKMDKDSLKEGAKEAKEKEKEEKKAKKSSKSSEDEAGYDLSRYTTKLKRITESLLKNDLPTALFPYITPPSHDEQPSAVPVSTSKAKWGGKGKEREDESQEKGLKGGRVVVFVVGGCSYSELRGVYELTDSYQREVILGSTSVLSPKSFLKTFKDIKK